MPPPKGFYDDTEWLKEQLDIITSSKLHRTRAQQQEHVDNLYARGEIGRETWSKLTDLLSELTRWGPEGQRHIHISLSQRLKKK